MDDLFKLKGRLTTTAGQGVADMVLAIVDDDDDDDPDLLGIGSTDAQGRFKIEFLGSEFRQDMLEFEATPDIKVVVSHLFDGTYKPIFMRQFPKLKWSEGTADLGDIPLVGVELNNPKPLPDLEAFPGFEKRAERLDIDVPMARECLAEVAPIVEHLTGWSGLLDGLKVEVSDSLTPYMLRESLKARGTDVDSFAASLQAFVANLMQQPGAGCALYDPHIHTVIINTHIMEQVGLEALKIICGHELVHVGQFKFTPGLKAYNLHHLQLLGTAQTDEALNKAAAMGGYMTELEGYAKYIETDFLKKSYYKFGVLAYHASTTEALLQAILTSAMGDVKQNQDAKTAQYTDGLDLYRKRQVGDRPVRFHLDVAKLPGGAAFAPKA